VRRGDVAIVSAAGDYGKPRPAVVVQSNLLTQAGLNSVIVCLLTSQVGAAPPFRVEVEPAAGNGLKIPSQIMVEKVVTVRASRIASVIGRLDDERLLQLDRAFAFVLGLGE
jgi:mRNA interferase MazF